MPVGFFKLDAASGNITLAQSLCGGPFTNVTKATLVVTARDGGIPSQVAPPNMKEHCNYKTMRIPLQPIFATRPGQISLAL